MSIGQNHVFNKLDKDSKALASDQRLVRLIAKGKNKSANLPHSLCVSIPALTAEHVVEYIDALMPYVVGMVADTQDKIIREYRIETGAADINEELFDIPHCIEYLAANATGERLTGDMLREWFTEDYKDATIEWLKSKPALSGATAETLEHKFNAVCGVIAEYANPHWKPTKPLINMILDLGASVECDGRMAQIIAKTEAHQKRMEAESEALDGII